MTCHLLPTQHLLFLLSRQLLFTLFTTYPTLPHPPTQHTLPSSSHSTYPTFCQPNTLPTSCYLTYYLSNTTPTLMMPYLLSSSHLMKPHLLPVQFSPIHFPNSLPTRYHSPFPPISTYRLPNTLRLLWHPAYNLPNTSPTQLPTYLITLHPHKDPTFHHSREQ